MKRFFTIAVVLGFILALSACTSTGTSKNAMSAGASKDAVSENQKKAIEFVESMETGDLSTLNYINPKQYTQHNLSVGDGLDGFAAMREQIPEDIVIKADVVRSFNDGDYVVVHTAYDFFGPKVGFDIYRFEDGLLVEHWDNVQEIAPPNPSGHTQLDGPTEIKDLDKTEENKELVRGLIQDVFIDGNGEKITDYISTETYIQHNPGLGDGLEAFMAEMTKAGTVFRKNHVILGQGNFVLAVSEGDFAGNPASIYDLFRIENGKVVEHWDVLETIPPKSEWKNDNGKFGFPTK